ncbi:MAG: cob(I)yrinic acid a,c-diamide adenosyltransferase [Syntrophobacterales bacterium]|nr:cob(I)yrinic acid a,c-diamide adenosyltransferase [Syntrophobacterales bacterium]
MSREEHRGLIIVFTGEGKGKTSAALGMVLRAAGHGMRIGIFQFIKGRWHPGELKALSLLPSVEVVRYGAGFTKKREDLSKDVELVGEGWRRAREAILEDYYDMVVLDEINYAFHRGFLDVEEVLKTLRARPEGMHVILTGRYAPQILIEAADLVTEMRLIKHHLKERNIKAQKGVEF